MTPSTRAGPPAFAAAVAQLRARAPQARPRVAVVLGSGWGGLTAHIDAATRLRYSELDGFPHASVPGHAGELWLGRIGTREVAVLCGRHHAFESGDVTGMQLPLLALQALGCEVLVQTNAAGSLRAEMGPGSLMVLADHINLAQRSPLVGAGGAERFVGMHDAYDAGLRAGAHAVARGAGVTLHEGVYLWTLGPQFETPAEIRMFGRMGADAVGMSTVPETILARHAGLRVLAISLITNMAAGLSGETLSHAHTLAQAAAASDRIGRLLAGVIAAIEV
jgi:purine-nucleoside phosphorylase